MTSASNLQLYAVANVTVNGTLLAEEASVTVDRATNSQQVITVAKGYAGESPGAPMTEISVDEAVPSTFFELDASGFMGELQAVEFTIYVGSANSLTFKGFIISDNFRHAANDKSNLSFRARGSFSSWQGPSLVS